LLPLPSYDPARAWTGWDTLELVALGESGDAAPIELGARIEVTRHLLMQQLCACGHTTQAQAARATDDPLWPGVDISQQRWLGPRLAAALVYWIVLASLEVQGMPGGQDGVITAVVSLGRTDVADAAVMVHVVVPTHEFSAPARPATRCRTRRSCGPVRA
jgi:hypothetical protein